LASACRNTACNGNTDAKDSQTRRTVTRIRPASLRSRDRMVSMRVHGGTDVEPTATVVVTRGEETETEEFTGTGGGMVDATFAALKKASGLEPHLLDYRVVPVTSGADAMAEVNVVIQLNGMSRSGRAISTDVVEGSGRAFVEALNGVLNAGAGVPV